MASPKKPRPIPTTPEERATQHRRQVLIQIWLPLTVGTLLVLAVAGLAIAGTVNKSSEVNRWGNISAVYVMLPTLVTSLLTLSLLVLAILGISKLLVKVPVWLAAVQKIFARIAALVKAYADKLAAPVVAVGGVTSGLNAARRKLTR